ncbi:MAG: ChaN family lipoprotein [Deltaproteobacteria bacterium]|nr:ChaN family lipoprotein [Deltaproteobacteria bacterium]
MRRPSVGWIPLLGLLNVLSACSASSWQAPLGRDHVLVGRIWDVAAGKFIDRRDLDTRLARADFVLLGEKHDNPDHHRLQADILRTLIGAGRRPAVAFEMYTADDADAIASHLARAPKDAAGLGPAVNWDTSGWPDWAMYQPIAEAALGARQPIIAANLSNSTARKMSRDGQALDASLTRELGLDRPLADPLRARMAADIRHSHCGYGSEASVNAMVEVQRARDAQMARSLIKGATADGAVLIAGSGHGRNDYGVPIYLAAAAGNKRVVSIAFTEVDERAVDPGLYALPEDAGRAPFDYLWFTPRVDNEDPCEKFKAQIERLKKPQ